MALSIKTADAVHAGCGTIHSVTKQGPADIGVPDALTSHATVLRTRRGQALTLAPQDGKTAFIVRSGVLMLHLSLPHSPRQVAALVFPGDLIRTDFAPLCAKATLVAAAAGEVWRVPFKAIERLAASDPAVMRYFGDAVARHITRQSIHAATLGRLDSEQRVATLLVELALRTGRCLPQGVVFNLPVSRKDIADYLGLNPDTLSRIMSRFRSASLFGHADRNTILVRDFAALAARSPAAKSLMALGGAPHGPSIDETA
jgi:CRP/FNR family transcriptional regulator, anaerobic regulatory protein